MIHRLEKFFQFFRAVMQVHERKIIIHFHLTGRRRWYRKHVFEDRRLLRQDRFVHSKVDKISIGAFSRENDTSILKI
jgi:hypothetical protein